MSKTKHISRFNSKNKSPKIKKRKNKQKKRTRPAVATFARKTLFSTESGYRLVPFQTTIVSQVKVLNGRGACAKENSGGGAGGYWGVAGGSFLWSDTKGGGSYFETPLEENLVLM